MSMFHKYFYFFRDVNGIVVLWGFHQLVPKEESFITNVRKA